MGSIVSVWYFLENKKCREKLFRQVWNSRSQNKHEHNNNNNPKTQIKSFLYLSTEDMGEQSFIVFVFTPNLNMDPFMWSIHTQSLLCLNQVFTEESHERHYVRHLCFSVKLKVAVHFLFSIHHKDGKNWQHWNHKNICSCSVNYNFFNSWPFSLHSDLNLKFTD